MQNKVFYIIRISAQPCWGSSRSCHKTIRDSTRDDGKDAPYPSTSTVRTECLCESNTFWQIKSYVRHLQSQSKDSCYDKNLRNAFTAIGKDLSFHFLSLCLFVSCLTWRFRTKAIFRKILIPKLILFLCIMSLSNLKKELLCCW